MRITIVVVVLIWLIPTLGVLITSLRPQDAANRTGWWTVFADPFDAGEWTLENYRTVLDAGRLQQRLPEQPGRGHPVDDHPDHHCRVRGLCVLVDAVPRGAT